MEETDQLAKRIDVKMTQELFDAVVELAPDVRRPNRRGRQGKQAEFCRVAIADYVARKKGARRPKTPEPEPTIGEAAVLTAMREDKPLAAAFVTLARAAAKRDDIRDLVERLAATISPQGRARRRGPKDRRD